MTRIILGAGLSGLSAAYYAVRRLPKDKIIVIEASDRVGGWLRSDVQNDGTIFEQSARTIRPRGRSGVNTLHLLDSLGLSDEVRPVGPAALTRMVFVNGKLHTLPSNFLGIFWKQAPFSKPIVAHLFKDVFTPKRTAVNNDESIYDFVNRRFGREIADYLVSPMVCGICGGNAKEISVKFLMESLFELEQKHGSITKGLLADMFNSKSTDDSTVKSLLHNRAQKEKWNVYSFKSGIEVLPKALKRNLELMDVEIKLNSQVNKVELNKELVTAHMKDGSCVKGTSLISSLPARNLGSLLAVQHPKLASLLGSIPTVSMCVINIKYNRKVIKNEGFGFLVAPQENLPILGIIYDSCCFPAMENTVLTVMMGGFMYKKYFSDKTKDAEVVDIALQQIKNILGVHEKPESYKVNFLMNCIPQYIVGHSNKISSINAYITSEKLPLSLCGASYYGVGVNDVIMSAKNAVENISTVDLK